MSVKYQKKQRQNPNTSIIQQSHQHFPYNHNNNHNQHVHQAQNHYYQQQLQLYEQINIVDNILEFNKKIICQVRDVSIQCLCVSYINKSQNCNNDQNQRQDRYQRQDRQSQQIQEQQQYQNKHIQQLTSSLLLRRQYMLQINGTYLYITKNNVKHNFNLNQYITAHNNNHHNNNNTYLRLELPNTDKFIPQNCSISLQNNHHKQRQKQRQMGKYMIISDRNKILQSNKNNNNLIVITIKPIQLIEQNVRLRALKLMNKSVNWGNQSQNLSHVQQENCNNNQLRRINNSSVKKLNINWGNNNTNNNRQNSGSQVHNSPTLSDWRVPRRQLRKGSMCNITTINQTSTINTTVTTTKILNRNININNQNDIKTDNKNVNNNNNNKRKQVEVRGVEYKKSIDSKCDRQYSKSISKSRNRNLASFLNNNSTANININNSKSNINLNMNLSASGIRRNTINNQIKQNKNNNSNNKMINQRSFRNISTNQIYTHSDIKTDISQKEMKQRSNMKRKMSIKRQQYQYLSKSKRLKSIDRNRTLQNRKSIQKYDDRIGTQIQSIQNDNFNDNHNEQDYDEYSSSSFYTAKKQQDYLQNQQKQQKYKEPLSQHKISQKPQNKTQKYPQTEHKQNTNYIQSPIMPMNLSSSTKKFTNNMNMSSKNIGDGTRKCNKKLDLSQSKIQDNNGKDSSICKDLSGIKIKLNNNNNSINKANDKNNTTDNKHPINKNISQTKIAQLSRTLHPKTQHNNNNSIMFNANNNTNLSNHK